MILDSSDIMLLLFWHIPKQIVHDNEAHLSVKSFVDYAARSSFRILYQRHTNLGLIVYPKLLTRLFSNFSGSWSNQVGKIGIKSLVNIYGPKGSNPHGFYTLFSFVWVLSNLTVEDSNPISAYGFLMNMMTRIINNCLKEVEELYKKLLQAQQYVDLYQAQISKTFNKKVKYKIFRHGDLVQVLRRSRALKHKSQDKFGAKGEGLCRRRKF